MYENSTTVPVFMLQFLHMKNTQQGFAGTLIVCVVAATLIFLVSYSLGRHNPKDPQIAEKQRINIEITK